MTSELKVFKTNNYAKFTFLEGNRGLKTAHLLRLKKSFKENPLVSVIIVNDDFQIIDGQHRYTICQELNLPLYYIILSNYGTSMRVAAVLLVSSDSSTTLPQSTFNVK